MSRKWLAARFGLIPVALIVILAAAGVVMAVQQTEPFELDGNAVDDTGGGVDWANIYAPQVEPAEHSSFIADISAPNSDSIFTGGSSKDISEISQWRHAIGNVPDKDDIRDAYVAAYNVEGSPTLYFGADRYANVGDAQIGIWLFAEKVEMLPDGTFSGSHTDRDLLVLSNFVGGGDTSNIQVYRWNGQADPANPLLLVAEGTAEGALSVCTDNDLACAFTNPGGEVSPWPFSPKSGADNIFPEVSFFEGGVDLGALLGPDGLGCHSTFLAETRSSQEPTAQLKDIIIGSLNLCDLTVTLTGDESSKISDPVTYTATIENSGLVTLHQQDIWATVVGDLSSLGAGAGCDTLAPGQSCELNVEYTIAAGDSDPLLNALTGIYQTGSGDTVSASAEHAVNLFQPSITLANLGSTQNAVVGDSVTFTLYLENTSSSDSPNLTCTISDAPLSIEETVNLAPGEQHTVTATYTVQADDPSVLANLVSVHCQVDGFPNILDASSEFVLTVGAAPEPTQPSTNPPAETKPSATPVPTSTEEANPPISNNEPPNQTPTPAPKEPVSSERAQEEASSNLTGEGCSPGFWQGGYGRWLWNDPNDPDWKGHGTNPFTHETAFNSIFAPSSATDDMELYSFVRRGGGPWNWRKAARNVVAGYLNASYGMNYPFSTEEIADMWANAVSGATTFEEVHSLLGEANNLGCPIGD